VNLCTVVIASVCCIFVCCVKMVQFNKLVTRTQQDGSNPIQQINVLYDDVVTGPKYVGAVLM